MSVNRLIRTLERSLASSKPTPPQRQQKRRRRRMRRNPSQPQGTTTSTMPMAYATHVRPYFRTARGNRDTLTISGCDLVRPIASTGDGGDVIFSTITANPAYWEGTKIAAVASAYFNYRPLKLVFHYVPQVPVTYAGTVVSGTIWAGQVGGDSLQQSLLTSNGGVMTQCYVPVNSQLKLGTALPQRLFYMQGELGPETNPFTWLAINVGGVTSGIATPQIPGYYFLEYTYELSNPLGQGAIYNRQYSVSLPTKGLPRATSAVVLNGSNYVSPGTILNLDDGKWFQAGDPVDTTGLHAVIFSFRATAGTNYPPGPEPEPSPEPEPEPSDIVGVQELWDWLGKHGANPSSVWIYPSYDLAPALRNSQFYQYLTIDAETGEYAAWQSKDSSAAVRFVGKSGISCITLALRYEEAVTQWEGSTMVSDGGEGESQRLETFQWASETLNEEPPCLGGAYITQASSPSYPADVNVTTYSAAVNWQSDVPQWWGDVFNQNVYYLISPQITSQIPYEGEYTQGRVVYCVPPNILAARSAALTQLGTLRKNALPQPQN